MNPKEGVREENGSTQCPGAASSENKWELVLCQRACVDAKGLFPDCVDLPDLPPTARSRSEGEDLLQTQLHTAGSVQTSALFVELPG